MRFVNFVGRNKKGLGLQLEDGKVLPLEGMLPEKILTMQDLIEWCDMDFDWAKNFISHFEKLEDKVLAPESVVLLSPFEQTRHDIICVGLNYKEHVNETNRAFNTDYKLPKAPVYFSKRVSDPVGHQGVIERHADLTQQLDYEAELGVIIGKTGRDITKDNALNYVFGYTIINDVSARDLQQLHSQWYRGKSLDSFVVAGPCVVTSDELINPHSLDISCRVNGELRQHSNTDMLIFNIDDLIVNLSSGMTLHAGDIIATGTPSGVGMGMTPPQFLQSGDCVECEVQNIGKLKVSVS